MLSGIIRGKAISCCSLGTRTSAAHSPCNAVSASVGSCVIIIGRQRNPPTGLRDEMGHANKANRVRPADRSGEQPPEFTSEKQAKRILSLLIGHANVLAFTLTHGPQHYEPLFYAHKIEGNSVPIIDEWCCGYVKGIALDPEGWQPLIDARPDWFEVIHLYGTKSGWERLKELVDAHEDSTARHQAFVDRIAPAGRNIHAYWLASRTSRERLPQLSRAPTPGRNDPCPCGSGKKFKRCHGAPDATLH
jgi:uncharacterized protein